MYILTTGDTAYGVPIMKFTLTYDGELPSGGNGSRKAKEKWEIRKQISAQLEELWKIHPCLIKARNNRCLPKDGKFLHVEAHHTTPTNNVTQVVNAENKQELFDLCAPIDRGGVNFVPLVRNSYATVCGLKILFMRKESVGKVYQGGDLDNRIKTLLDALSIPNIEAANAGKQDSDNGNTFHCLLEDDALVTGLTVETQRLLSKPESSEKEVRLIIEVDVRVTDARSYNTLFLGD